MAMVKLAYDEVGKEVGTRSWLIGHIKYFQYKDWPKTSIDMIYLIIYQMITLVLEKTQKKARLEAIIQSQIQGHKVVQVGSISFQ